MADDFRPATAGQADEQGHRRLISGVSQDIVPVSIVAGGTAGPIVTSGGQAPSAGGGLDPRITPLHVLVASGSIVGSTSLSVGAVQVSGQTVISKVSGETVVVSVSGQNVVAPLVTSGGQAISAGSGLDPRTMPLHVILVSGSLLGSTSVAVSSGLNVVAQISGQRVITDSGSVTDLADRGARDVGSTRLRITSSIADTTQSNRLVSQTDQFGNEALPAVVTMAFDGTNFNRIRTLSGLSVAGSGAPWVGLLAVGLASGANIVQASGATVIAKISGETLAISVSGQTVLAKISGETIANIGSGNIGVTMSGGTVRILDATDASIIAGVRLMSVDGGIAARSALIVRAGVEVLEGLDFNRARGMLGVSGINTLSGVTIGVLAVGFVSGYNYVDVSGMTVYARVSGQPVRVSGETVVTSISGNTVLAKVSGETVVASVSGNYVYLAASGGPGITAGSGSLQSGAVPLHVLVISGSVAGTGGGTSSGLAVLISGQAVTTLLSGQPVGVSGQTVVVSVSGNYVYLAASGGPGITAGSGSLQSGAVPLHVLVISGSVVGGGGTSTTNISGQAVTTLVSGQPVVLAVSGPRYPSAGSGLDPSTYPLHVMVVSGSLLAGGASVSVASGLAVLISGQAVVAQVSGQTLVVSVSGQVQYIAASGGPIVTAGSGSLQSGAVPLHVLVISGSVVGGGGTSTGTSGLGVLISGQAVVAAVSGQTVIASTSGQVNLVADSSGNLFTSTSGAGPLSGVFRRAMDVDVISGETINAIIQSSIIMVPVDIQNLQSGVIFPTLPTRYIGISQSGGGASVSGSFSPNSSGDEGIWSLSGTTSSGAFRAASGQRVPLRVDPVGRLITRVDRVHTIDSGLGAARVYAGVATSGYTLIAAPNSGNYLRVKSLSDSLLSSGILAWVAYSFGSGGTPFFRHKHIFNASGLGGNTQVTDEWQMPSESPTIQGPPNPGPGGFVISYVPHLGTDRSGVAYTAMIEEVGSGDIY